ncbi:hypothetical protein [Nonomuraea typhae]|uniref:Tetratricopeptide repeat protein n=1 Tax=Nonomuraea typhae TaxID=2603600 RepID=A0ABW7ZCQ8_9ACTN
MTSTARPRPTRSSKTAAQQLATARGIEGIEVFDLPDGFRQILDLVEAAEDEERRDPGPGPALAGLLAASQTLVERLPEVADAHYVRGYALFLLSRQGVAVSRESLSEMIATIRLAHGHHWARYHAVVLCHEKGAYEAVTEHFAAMDRDFFATQGKDWRYLVAWQYAIDSRLRLGRIDRFETELSHLVRAYLTYSDDPDELLPGRGC